MRLILARHGNTFSKGDKVFWVGAKNDLPLVAEGCAQAKRLANVLSEKMGVVAAYYAPLARTRQFTEIAVEKISPQPRLLVERRLIELDYGSWSGLTDEEVKGMFGAECLSAWNDRSIWPQDCGWSQSPEIIEEQINDWLAEIKHTYPADSTILAVTSNGRLRYFLKLVQGEFERRVAEKTFKVGTGKICLLQVAPDAISVQLWNADPESLLEVQ